MQQPLVPPAPSSDAANAKGELKPDRKAILNDLDDCTDCHNKAKRECNFKRCKLCCSRYTQMTGSMCDSHSSKESKARESLVGQVFTGIIDGLFENGFLITVDINNVVFKGLLFNSLCAVKVWKLPKTPAPIAGGGGQMKTPSGMTGIMDLSQPQASLPTGTISSGGPSGQQFVPAPLAQFASQLPNQMFAPNIGQGGGNNNAGKRKYVKSGLYSKKRGRDGDGKGKDDDEEGSDDDESASGAVQPSFLTLMGQNQAPGKQLDWAASLPTVPSASSGKPKRKGPKRALTNYLVFVAEQRKKILPQYPNSTFKEIADIIGRKWKSMSEEEKRVYTEAADRDKERWKREKEEFLRAEAESKQREKQLAAVTQAVLAQANSVSMPQSLSAGSALPFQISSSMFNVAGIPQGIPVGVQVSAPPVRAVSPAGTQNAMDMTNMPAGLVASGTKAASNDSAARGDTDDDADDDEMAEVHELAAAAQEAIKTPKSGDKSGDKGNSPKRSRRK